MKIISWDIGSDNLAYYLMEVKDDNKYKILKWKKMDILEDLRDKKHKCEAIQKNSKDCRVTAYFFLTNDAGEEKYYCRRHSKSQYIDGQELIEISAKKNCCGTNKNGKKCKRKTTFKDEGENYYCNVHRKAATSTNSAIGTITKIIDPKKISFFERSIFIPKIIDDDPDLLDVDEVLIENQPVNKNPVMKSIQIILYTAYLIRGIVDGKSPRLKEIRLINATQKMKIYDGPQIECKIKDVHARNKFLAIEYCKYFIGKLDFENRDFWLEYFLSHSKKDDLADTLLQALYFIKKSQ